MMIVRAEEPVRQNPMQLPIQIEGLSCDSRRIKKNYLFAALPGARVDGRDYITQAIENGASVILAPTGTKIPDHSKPITLMESDNPRRDFALMAAGWYERQPSTIVAVTGTNGKTSTVQFARQIWQDRGLKAASVGTLGLNAPGLESKGTLTTPDPMGLHEALAELADHKITHLAMEASSHGIDQYRLDGVRLAAAGFTNLTRDHLDYHGSMEDYFKAKAALFERLLPATGTAVLNADIDQFKALQDICTARRQRMISYGAAGKELRLINWQPTPSGQEMELDFYGEKHNIALKLAGQFQAMNVLCALGLVIGSGHDRFEALSALPRLSGVRGRMEPVAEGVYVDYAHTPDALETVLKALRPHASNNLIVVFGCGGDRDRGKRPQMGEIATKFADHVIVTDDNPRFEKPAPIRAEILDKAPGATEIGDRKKAIAAGLEQMQQGDVLLIAGKGHEQGQIIGDDVLPFDDAKTVRSLLGKDQ